MYGRAQRPTRGSALVRPIADWCFYVCSPLWSSRQQLHAVPSTSHARMARAVMDVLLHLRLQ